MNVSYIYLDYISVIVTHFCFEFFRTKSGIWFFFITVYISLFTKVSTEMEWQRRCLIFFTGVGVLVMLFPIYKGVEWVWTYSCISIQKNKCWKYMRAWNARIHQSRQQTVLKVRWCLIKSTCIPTWSGAVHIYKSEFMYHFYSVHSIISVSIGIL